MIRLSRYLLEIIVFVCGAVVMIFELAGSRVLGPYLGTSIFVWTSIIGIILGSLSVGYYVGGRLADKKPDRATLSHIILFSGISIGLTFLIKDIFLAFLQMNRLGVKINAVIASCVLFIPASTLLGMVSPYAAKLKIQSLLTSGRAVGSLYALSTAGSICGTFLSGFYLIPHFGTNKILIGLVATLTILSIVPSFERQSSKRHTISLVLLVATVFGWFAVGTVQAMREKNGFIDVDTAYNRVWIYDYHRPDTGQTVRQMKINNELSSAMFLDRDDLVFSYTAYYHLARHFHPNFHSALMLGGAGYSFPKDFLRTYPDATLDVVEIDPMLTELAKKYFGLRGDPRLTIIHEDGRVFLNTTQKKYDVFFGDAFSSHYSLPYQLTTKEAVQKTYDLLQSSGVVVVNIISSIDGEAGQFLRAEYATYKQIFPQVYLFPVHNPENGSTVQNTMLVAIKSDKIPTFESDDPITNEQLSHLWTKKIDKDIPILTDDFAPVDYYISKTI